MELVLYARSNIFAVPVIEDVVSDVPDLRISPNFVCLVDWSWPWRKAQYNSSAAPFQGLAFHLGLLCVTRIGDAIDLDQINSPTRVQSCQTVVVRQAGLIVRDSVIVRSSIDVFRPNVLPDFEPCKQHRLL